MLVRVDLAAYGGRGAEDGYADAFVDVLVLDLRERRVMGEFETHGEVGLISTHDDIESIDFAAKAAVKKLEELR